MLKKILFVPDLHAPYEDRRAFDLVLKAGAALRPHIVVTLGDFFDFYSVSSHDKNPTRTVQLDVEIAAGQKQLKRLAALGAERNIFVAGNHEDRLSRYLMTKAPELFNTVKIEKVLELEKLGFSYIPYKQSVQLGKLFVTHDTGRAGRFANLQSLDDFQDNVVIGHTHRLGYGVSGNAKGRPHIGAMFGWLGDTMAIDYMHQVKAKRDWALGFGTGYMQSNGVVHVVPHPIVNYTCVVEGKLISG